MCLFEEEEKKKLEITNTAFDEMKLVSLGFRPYLKSDLKTGSNAPLFFFLSFFPRFFFTLRSLFKRYAPGTMYNWWD